jgi:hypothetical protein
MLRHDRTIISAGIVAAAVLIGALPGLPAEGMWLPHDIPEEVLEGMREDGLELERSRLYTPQGTGVANAVVKLGATGSFVSPEGLILTNHHVAFGAVQRISSAGKNYIREGFLADSRAEEVPAYGYQAYVTLSVTDVTRRVLDAVDDSVSPLERFEAIERRIKEIVLEEEEEGRYSDVGSFSGGARYILYKYLKIQDIRVVYVPARAIGEYGGDIDNWMWPRHTADFSFLRAYVGPDGQPAPYSPDNVPYEPRSYLRISTEGLEDGDFGIIIGFPGRTQRYLTSHALARLEGFTYPEKVRIYRKMLAILDARAAEDPEAAIRVASRIKSINNRMKNNLGMIEGFERFGLVKQARRDEMERAESLDEADRDRYLGLIKEFETMYEERDRFARKDMLLDFLTGWWRVLGQAMQIYEWSVEKTRDDLDREPDFMDREIADKRLWLKYFQTGLDPESDRLVLAMMLREAAALPEDQRIQGLKHIVGGKEGAELDRAIREALDHLYGRTRLLEAEERLRLFDMSNEKLRQEGDPFIQLAARLYPEHVKRRKREKSIKGSLTLLQPRWIELIARVSGRPVYPDANGTMRINHGLVKGYSPADAVRYEPLTTLPGMVEKHTGQPPFDAPGRILRAAARDAENPYVAEELGDVPVNLLTTHDSTGGNSGSPLLNGRGEVVGCLFDGNYEAMTADFEFQPDITRSIHVDIRYVLWVAECVDEAYGVLEELGIRRRWEAGGQTGSDG